MSLKEFGRPFILYLILFGFALSGYALAKQYNIRIGLPNLFWSINCQLFLGLLLAAFYRSRSPWFILILLCHIVFYSLNYNILQIKSTLILYAIAIALIILFWMMKRRQPTHQISTSFISYWAITLMAWWLIVYNL
jgi:hypothetical protein